MTRLTRLARGRPPVPTGTLAIGVGLVVLGLTSYAFLVLAGRALGPSRYASLSVTWALVFLLGPGFFLPLEQEVGRAVASRRAHGQGSGPVIRQAGWVGGGLAVLLVGLVAGAAAPLRDRLFDGQVLLVAGLGAGLVGYFAEHLLRGVLAGNGRFGPYGTVLALDGSLRLLGCVVLLAAGVDTPGPYGLLVGLAPLGAVAVGLRGNRDIVRASGAGSGGHQQSPPAAWRELSSALGWLLAASLLAQLLVSAGPLAVKLLATEREHAIAGRFLAGLVVVRVPVYLFQAIAAAVLPDLSRLAASGRWADFRAGLGRLVWAVVGLGVAGVAGAVAAGPLAVRVLFGAGFRLSRPDLAYLAGASAAYMLALALGQALIALSAHARTAVAWAVGVVAFAVTTALLSGLTFRVAIGFLAGAGATAATMALLLLPLLRAPGSPGPGEATSMTPQATGTA
jgi:O-antigen/teichoic acid export membrane protein